MASVILSKKLAHGHYEATENTIHLHMNTQNMVEQETKESMKMQLLAA